MSVSNINYLSKSDSFKKRYAVILAGGDGTRLQSLTRFVAGDERPKQFCPIINDKTLLDRTRERVALSVSPKNTYFSLTKKHEQYYRGQLDDVPDSHLVVQPENRGTAPAILYSLMRLAALAPHSTVAVFPSDHHFRDDVTFMKHVDLAFDTAERDSASAVLLGVEPDAAEISYGWIEPAQTLFGGLSRSVSRVRRFWEKPTASVADQLFKSGCLWNSFVMVGRVETFLTMFDTHLPELYRMFSSVSRFFGTPNEVEALQGVYSSINDVNFSSQVLEHSADNLLVLRVNNVGWTDLGEPNRVMGALESLGLQPQWMTALAA